MKMKCLGLSVFSVILYVVFYLSLNNYETQRKIIVEPDVPKQAEIVPEIQRENEIEYEYEKQYVAGYLNIKYAGCVYDGITDDSTNIMSLVDEKLYFPKGTISLSREAVQSLVHKKIVGEGKIIINDFFKMSPTKYAGNGEIDVKDFYNDYIASLNLPNELKPYTDFGHQNRNGWINPYTILSPDYSVEYVVCWGQVYPVDQKRFTVEDDMITIYISAMDVSYYDDVNQQWIMVRENVLPKLYGFYDKNYKSVSNGGVEFIPIKEATVIEHEGYVEVTFPHNFINDRVLHFGVDVKNVPVDKELYLIGEYDVWVTNEKYVNKFTANVGIDLYLPRTYEKRVREYCGSRYIAVTQKPKRVCLAYVAGNNELLSNLDK